MILLAGALLLVAIATRNVREPAGAPAVPAAAAAPRAALDPLSYPGHGLRLGRPQDWSAERKGRVVRLRSGDGRTVVAIAVQRRRPRPVVARRAAVRALRAGYPAARTLTRRAGSLSGRPAAVAELVLRGRGGARLDGLVVAARTRWRTYVVSAVSARPAGERQLADLADVLGAVELHRPVRTR